LLARGDHLLHAALVEARASLEHLLREIERVLQADAAVAEVAAALGEQPAARRVVHVDAVLVGEAEEDVAQRIAGTRLLAEAVGEGLGMDAAPVDGRRVELRVVIAPAREELEASLRQR